MSSLCIFLKFFGMSSSPNQFNQKHLSKRISKRNRRVISTPFDQLEISNRRAYIHGIKFKSYKLFGKLDLPTEHMNIYSKVIYANMIAYEMSPNTNTRYEVTSYVNFMKSLIVCSEDVKELREKGVICNHLGTDEDAAKLFQDITTYDVVSHGSTLVDVIKDIQNHVSSKAKTSMAECYWTYFSTSWSIIALLIAGALLFLTIMQL
uniref:UPF0481 protein At3g02645 n=1 Tax=Nicotiana sylvestris TaxID=4096 RepID=A0A1U7WT49_NICSY|nr:PREDICTED: putative UPF0481 protein At3g02645 [Nicotiana sylvestris]